MSDADTPLPADAALAEARLELDALRADIALAADAMLFAAESGVGKVAAAWEGDAAALGEIEQLFLAMLEACAFQDITGQRLTKLQRLLAGGADAFAVSSLEHGPALHGQGLDQAAADSLFDDAPPVRQAG